MCIFARSMKKIADFLAKPFFHDYRTLFGLWMLLPIIMWLAKMTLPRIILECSERLEPLSA